MRGLRRCLENGSLEGRRSIMSQSTGMLRQSCQFLHMHLHFASSSSASSGTRVLWTEMSLELAACWNRLFHAIHGSTGNGLSQDTVAECSVITTANSSKIENSQIDSSRG